MLSSSYSEANCRCGLLCLPFVAPSDQVPSKTRGVPPIVGDEEEEALLVLPTLLLPSGESSAADIMCGASPPPLRILKGGPVISQDRSRLDPRLQPDLRPQVSQVVTPADRHNEPILSLYQHELQKGGLVDQIRHVQTRLGLHCNDPKSQSYPRI